MTRYGHKLFIIPKCGRDRSRSHSRHRSLSRGRDGKGVTDADIAHIRDVEGPRENREIMDNLMDFKIEGSWLGIERSPNARFIILNPRSRPPVTRCFLLDRPCAAGARSVAVIRFSSINPWIPIHVDHTSSNVMDHVKPLFCKKWKKVAQKVIKKRVPFVSNTRG